MLVPKSISKQRFAEKNQPGGGKASCHAVAFYDKEPCFGWSKGWDAAKAVSVSVCMCIMRLLVSTFYVFKSDIMQTT